MFGLFEPSHWYWATAAGYALLLAFSLAAGGRGLLRGHLLLVATAGLIWSLVIARTPHWRNSPIGVAEFAAEMLYMGSWHLLLFRMLRGPYHQSMPEVARRFLVTFWFVLVLIGVLAAGWSTLNRGAEPLVPGIMNGLGLAAGLSCLALASQLHHDAPVEDPPALRMLVIAAALVATGQIVIFGVGLLAVHAPSSVLLGRALLTLPVTLLLAQTVNHKPQWSLAIFVSPQARAYVPRFMAVAVALVLLVAFIPLCRSLPAEQAQPLAMFLIGLTGAPVAALMFSERLSARARVFLSKRFLAFRYNYRDQWLRLIDTLASPEQRLPLPERSIKALAQIVSSPGGLLWMRDEHDDHLVCMAGWNARIWSDARVSPDDAVVRFMHERQWILDTAELTRNPAMYEGITRPAWLEPFPDALLLVPLISNKTLIGFILLLQSSSSFRLTFEDIDLLRTSGRQVAAHLAQYQTDQRLGEAKQFEAFNRLTAFLMHDLKNLIAQQTLVVSNAARHKGNPAFFEDAIATIENSVARMSKLLQQLQSGEASGRRSRVRVGPVLQEAIDRCRDRDPQPRLTDLDDEVHVYIDRERLTTVIAHLVRNAQEATPADGKVEVCAKHEGSSVVITIKDNGCGMDAEFVRTRLFRPFDTTKGSKGMGIGAYQARMFVLDSGGTLDVRSAPGEGTSITIRLPLSGPAEAED